MSLRKQFATDNEKEVNGVIVDFGTNADGSVIQFILARQSNANPEYAKAMEKATKQHRRRIELKAFTPKEARELNKAVFCATILKGWNNVTTADLTGDSKATGFAEFNETNARKLLDELPDLYDYLNEQSSSAALFQTEALEAEAKN